MTDFDISDLERRLEKPFDPVTAMSTVRDLNDLLVWAYVEGDKKDFFRGKYEETINEIEERQLFQDDFDYLAHKAYFYYLNKKTKRLITLVNSKRLHSPELLLLLVELMSAHAFPVSEVSFYVDRILESSNNPKIRIILGNLLARYGDFFFEKLRFSSNEFDEFTNKRGVTSVLHFTRLKNLPSILSNWLLTRNEITEWNVKCAVNDANRFDWKDWICTSLDFPNYKLFYRFRCLYWKDEWVILKLNSKIISKKHCLFFPINAAKRDIRKYNIEHNSIEAYHLMFSDTISWRKRKELDIPDNFTTDPQAEIIFLEKIETEYISGIVFESESALKSCDIGELNTLKSVEPELFRPRSDYPFWS